MKPSMAKMNNSLARAAADNPQAGLELHPVGTPFTPYTKRLKGGPQQLARQTDANAGSALSGMDRAMGAAADKLHPTGR